jgi:hypothetical protein
LKEDDDEEEEREEEVKVEVEVEEQPPWAHVVDVEAVRWLRRMQREDEEQFRLSERGSTVYIHYDDEHQIWDWMWERRRRKWIFVDGRKDENPFYRGAWNQGEQQPIRMEDGSVGIDRNAIQKKWVNRENSRNGTRRRRERETQKKKRRLASKMAKKDF